MDADDCLIVKCKISPMVKKKPVLFQKTKQACLPFTPLTDKQQRLAQQKRRSSSGGGGVAAPVEKKRKLSQSGEQKDKINKISNSPKPDTDNTTEISNACSVNIKKLSNNSINNATNKKTKTNKTTAPKTIKLAKKSKSTNRRRPGNGAKASSTVRKDIKTSNTTRKTSSRYHVAAEDEVSSSCEEKPLPCVHNQGKSSSKKKEWPRPAELLQKFVCREPTQQDEVSTSLGEGDGDKQAEKTEDEQEEKDPDGERDKELDEAVDERVIEKNKDEDKEDDGVQGRKGGDVENKQEKVVDEQITEQQGEVKQHEDLQHKQQDSEENDEPNATKLIEKINTIKVDKENETKSNGDDKFDTKNGAKTDIKVKTSFSQIVTKGKTNNLLNDTDIVVVSKPSPSPDMPNKKRKLEAASALKKDDKNKNKTCLKKKLDSEKGCLMSFIKKGVHSGIEKCNLVSAKSECETTKINSGVNGPVEQSSADEQEIESTTKQGKAESPKSDESMSKDLNRSESSSNMETHHLDTSSASADATSKEVMKNCTPSRKPLKTRRKAPKTPEEQQQEKRRQEELEKKKNEKVKKEEERLRLKKEREEEAKRQREMKELLKIENSKKKQEENDLKEKEKEEKRLKLDEKRAKEEEKKEGKKRQEEEKKRQGEEEQEKKAKVAAKFANFFTASKKEVPMEEAPCAQSKEGVFPQFQAGKNTAMAAVCRVRLSDKDREKLDGVIATHAHAAATASAETYLQQLRSGAHQPRTDVATRVMVVKEDNDYCMVIEDEEEEEEDDEVFPNNEGVVLSSGAADPRKVKGKLLKFCENRRPAYWGTWSKKAAHVGPRKPFAKEVIFDYDYDSDDDWEEEEENGESLSDSEGEKEEEEDQYEVDNDFFVPHGYLSDDEGQDDEDKENWDEEAMGSTMITNKDKLKVKQAEFEKELKQQTKQLKPRVLGCLWLHAAEVENTVAYDHLMRVLGSYRGVVCSSGGGTIACTLPTPPATPANSANVTPASSITEQITPATGIKRKFFRTFPAEAVPTLVRLVHGNRNNKVLLVQEFHQYWNLIKGDDNEATDIATTASAAIVATAVDTQELPKFVSKKKIENKICEIGEYKRCPDDGPYHGQFMWYVSLTERERHNVMDALLPNKWTYVGHSEDRLTTGDTAPGMKTPVTAGTSKNSPINMLKTPATNLITKFTKVLTEEEKVVVSNKVVKTLASAGKVQSNNKAKRTKKLMPVNAFSNGAISNTISRKSTSISACTPKDKITPKGCASSNKESIPKGCSDGKSSTTKLSSSKKQTVLFPVVRVQESNPSPKPKESSIMSFLKKTSTNAHLEISGEKHRERRSQSAANTEDNDVDCITLD